MSSFFFPSPNAVVPGNRAVLGRLRLQWVLILAIYLGVTSAGYYILLNWWQPRYAHRWLIVTALILLRELWLLWFGLLQNHRAGEAALLPTLGWGNALTVARGLLIALLAGFILAPPPPGALAWIPPLLYMSAAILDNLDGYVARITDHSTKLGEMLDMEYDVIGVFAAVVLGIAYGQLPLWYLVVGFARELFLLGHWILRRQGKPIAELTPSPDRRLIAGMQMGFLGVVLWPVITPPVTTVAAVLFAIPMIVSFGRDWMVTSRAWDPESHQYQLRRRRAKRLLEGYLPVAGRLAGVLGAIVILRRELPFFPVWQQTFIPSGLLWPLTLLLVLCLALFAAGVLGRLTALALTALACFDAYYGGFVWGSNGLLLVGALYVLQFGSGDLSLWRPEEARLRRRAGERPDTAP